MIKIVWIQVLLCTSTSAANCLHSFDHTTSKERMELFINFAFPYENHHHNVFRLSNFFCLFVFKFVQKPPNTSQSQWFQLEENIVIVKIYERDLPK